MNFKSLNLLSFLLFYLTIGFSENVSINLSIACTCQFTAGFILFRRT
jgi:hypothetical protein